MNQSNCIGMIGLGRFGKIFADLLGKKFTVVSCDINTSTSLADVLKTDLIIVAVPIRKFESVIKVIAPHVEQKTLVDVCSVKLYPVDIMTTHLPASTGIIATHPLFGTDSIAKSNHLKIMMHKTRDLHNQYQRLYQFFKEQEISIIEMTPDEHDKQAAHSQSITHFLGRALAAAKIDTNPAISTLGYQKLIDVMQQTCNDTWELFADMHHYNPYTATAIDKLITALHDTKQKLK